MGNQETLDLYFESNPTPMWFYDPASLRFLAVNAAAQQQYGFTAAEFSRMTLRDIRPPEDIPAVEQAAAAAARTPGLRGGRVWAHRRKDNSELLVEIHAHSCAFRGRPAVLVMALDVTERARATAALAASEERFRALIERSTDLIMVFDSEKRISFWSPSATACLGWRAEEVLGKRLWDLDIIHPEDRAALADATAALAGRGGATMRVVARHRCRDGSWRTLDGLGRNLLDEPTVRGIVVNARDITEQRRTEEQLRQAQKLESVGRLAGGVAHDFNNLLTVILSCAWELAEDLTDGRSVQMANVEEIRAAGERARDLTRQLLAFARRQHTAPVTMDLGDTVRSGERLLGRLLGEDVALRVQIGPGPLTIHGDPGQLDQVLVNLAVNARDAMPHGGALTLAVAKADRGSAGFRDCPVTGKAEWVRLEVRDTGIGIAPEVRAHLFEPFFTTKREGRGTGLGLATVYGIVTQHGGHLHVESDPGRGTTFAACFPLSLDVVQRKQATHTPTRTRGAGTILVVEDDPAVRNVTSRTLSEAGYRVLSAAEGAEALRLARGEPEELALVVTDVVMPGLNGPALLTELRAIRPGLRGLFVSGFMGEALSDAEALGCAILPKPFTGADLLTAVQSALGSAVPET